jgi:hypothetical protein
VSERVRIETKGGPTPKIQEVNAEDVDKFLEANPGAKQVGAVEATGTAAGPDDPAVPYDAGEGATDVRQARTQRAQAEDKAAKGPRE